MPSQRLVNYPDNLVRRGECTKKMIHSWGVLPCGRVYVHTVCLIRCGIAHRNMVHPPRLKYAHPHRIVLAMSKGSESTIDDGTRLQTRQLKANTTDCRGIVVVKDSILGQPRAGQMGATMRDTQTELSVAESHFLYSRQSGHISAAHTPRTRVQQHTTTFSFRFLDIIHVEGCSFAMETRILMSPGSVDFSRRRGQQTTYVAVIRTLHRTIQSVGATGGVYKGQGWHHIPVIASNFLGLIGHSPSKKLAMEDHLRVAS
ncbi:hypothetical protein GQ457_04G009750 [Hibiscus cannabinus]